ncbi:26244_t:CDS:2 [Gigaspora margarita]|uniref:Elongation factor 2 n=1 Tax=Gigaspora margarita TaxID=4874 RepID=A0ABM8VVD8_GIGMA|nr:26244_t:CDS:2 [Gigaspora margarita]
MKRTYKYYLKINKAQKQKFNKTLELCCWLHNFLLEQFKERDKNNQKQPTEYQLINSLLEIKKNYPFLKQIHKLKNLNLKKKYPKPKLIHRYNSFVYPLSIKRSDCGYKIDNSPLSKKKETRKLKLTLGRQNNHNSYLELKMVMERNFEGSAKTLTIKHKNRRYYALFSCDELKARPLPKIDKKVGIDLNLEQKSYITLSDGTRYKHPKHYKKMEKELVSRSKILSRKVKKSNNWLQSKFQLAKKWEKMVNQFKYYSRQVIKEIVGGYSKIAVENLNINDMVRDNKLSKHIYQARWGILFKVLAEEAEIATRQLVRVNPYNTSQICSFCGELAKKKLDLKQRLFKCWCCNFELDRDVNSARNILNRAILENRFDQHLPLNKEDIYEKKLAHIRNIGIMAHIDAGKTTTTERILYQSGKIRSIGEVHDKEGKGATMDFMDQERERGITIQSAATTVYWQEHQINIIDTPGHVDFTAEVERSLRVLDGGIVVLDGKKGVEAQTETVWRQAKKYKIPRLIFINKMDGVDNVEKFTENLKSIREKLHANPLPVQFPIGAGRELEGVVDIIEQKAYYCQMGDKEEKYQIKDIPPNLLEKAKKYRQELLEKIIEQDEELAMKYLEGGELSVAEIKKILRQATLTGKYFPVFCGSAYKHVGVKLLLDGVVDYLPSPLDIEDIPVFSPQEKSQKGVVNCNSPLSCLALAFKIVFDEYNNKLTFFRVYAGKIPANSYIYNVSRDEEERVSRLVQMHANEKRDVKEVGAGNIAVAIGLKHAITGDTFGDKKNPLLLEAISFAEPVISQAIEPKTNEDKDKLRDALEKLKIQDPSFKYWIDRETGQMVIAGMGELHLEITVERLRREYKLNIESKQRKVSYRETITKKLGEVGHFARVKLAFEPNPGKGFEFVDAKKGQEMSNKDAEEVREGMEEAMSSGLLLNYPLLDVKVTLLEGKRHMVDTKPGDFKNAAVLAFQGDGAAEKEKRIQELGVVLLEPIMQLEVVVPKDYMGDVLANLGSRRTLIENTEEKEGESYITGKTPLKEILNYSTILRQLTKGRGTYSMHLSHYQEVPKDTLEEILKEEKFEEFERIYRDLLENQPFPNKADKDQFVEVGALTTHYTKRGVIAAILAGLVGFEAIDLQDNSATALLNGLTYGEWKKKLTQRIREHCIANGYYNPNSPPDLTLLKTRKKKVKEALEDTNRRYKLLVYADSEDYQIITSALNYFEQLEKFKPANDDGGDDDIPREIDFLVEDHVGRVEKLINKLEQTEKPNGSSQPTDNSPIPPKPTQQKNNLEKEIQRLRDQVKELEGKINNTTDTTQKAAYQSMLDSIKKDIENKEKEKDKLNSQEKPAKPDNNKLN